MPLLVVCRGGAAECGLVRVRCRRQHADRNLETSARAADDFEVGHVFPAARAGGLQRIAAFEFGDVGSEIFGLQAHFVASAADADGELAVYPRREW